MLDGHRSGRSTGRVSCKSTELKRCSMIEMQYVESMKSLLRLLCEHKFGGRVQKMTVFLVRDQVVDQPMRTTWIGTVQGMSQWDRAKMTGCRPEGEGCSPPGVIDPPG